jgi:hypothetical protein
LSLIEPEGEKFGRFLVNFHPRERVGERRPADQSSLGSRGQLAGGKSPLEVEYLAQTLEVATCNRKHAERNFKRSLGEGLLGSPPPRSLDARED